MMTARRHLPSRREKVTHELRIGRSRRLFVEIGLYPDGAPGEVFLTFSKVGSDLRHFADEFAIAVSLLLQYGVPVDEMAGGPSGEVTGHDKIKNARSVIDLVSQLLRVEYGEQKS